MTDATAAEPTRLAPDLVHLARMAWFAGQYALTVRRAGPLVAPGETKPVLKGRTPGWRGLINSMLALSVDDQRQVDARLLPASTFKMGNRAELSDLIRRTREFLADSAEVDARRLNRTVRDLPPEIEGKNYPSYYLRNFHFQTDGYLSDRSAALYDWQVETLFTGTAALMRRQALVPIARAMQGRDPRRLILADIACGTGAFLSEVATAFPRLGQIGIDLSGPYLRAAQARLGQTKRRLWIEGQAESLPLADRSADFVSAVYLFHELPQAARIQVAAELARVLKPGGLLVIADALQTGDRPDFDGLLELFPVGFHEPFFDSWTKCDLTALLAPHGLIAIETRLAHLTKVMVFAHGIDQSGAL
jgi:ubiquinone/menaquinone biosynthesis C-methylase UbiE